MIDKLKETHQVVSSKKTKIDTAYHGVPFLGKVTYPYRGYVNRAAVNDTLKRVLKNNFGITGISTHSLRHTYGTMKKLLLMFILERKNRILKIYGEM